MSANQHGGTMSRFEADARSIANMPLLHLRALREEMKAMLEWRVAVMKQLDTVSTRLDRLNTDVQGLCGEVAGLDIKDISRQNELLTILRKPAHVDEDA